MIAKQKTQDFISKIYWRAFIWIILYRLILDLVYEIQISPIFSYMHITSDQTFESTITSWIILLMLTPMIFKHFNSNRFLLSNAILLLYFIAFVPMTSVIKFIPQDVEFICAIIIFWFLIFLLSHVIRPFRPIKIGLNVSKWIIIFATIISASAVIYVSGVYTGFRINLDFDILYDLRFEAREYKMPIILRYLLSLAKSVIPILMVIYMIQRRRIIVIMLTLIAILNFGINGEKSIFFYILVSVISYYCFNNKTKQLYPLAFGGLCIISFIESIIFKTTIASFMIIRRVLIIPAVLNTIYYKCANEYGLDYYRNSSLNLFGEESNYGGEVTFFIGNNYFGSSAIRANNGGFSDAFINFGWVGVILYPLILILIFLLFEAVTSNIKDKLLGLPILVITMSTRGTFIPTALLTSGVMFIWIILLALNSNNNPKLNKRIIS